MTEATQNKYSTKYMVEIRGQGVRKRCRKSQYIFHDLGYAPDLVIEQKAIDVALNGLKNRYKTIERAKLVVTRAEVTEFASGGRITSQGCIGQETKVEMDLMPLIS